MAQRGLYHKATKEDKFNRDWWVNNDAKRSWLRHMKRYNNRKYRRDKHQRKFQEEEYLTFY